jgi:hypothetical protein
MPALSTAMSAPTTVTDTRSAKTTLTSIALLACFALSTSLSVSSHSPLASTSWVVDSGASDHMSNNRTAFRTFKRLPNPYKIRLGDGHTVLARYSGLITVTEQLTILALYVPDFKFSLLSVPQFDTCGIETRFHSGSAHLHLHAASEPFLLAPKHDSLYIVSLAPPAPTMLAANITTRSQTRKRPPPTPPADDPASPLCLAPTPLASADDPTSPLCPAPSRSSNSSIKPLPSTSFNSTLPSIKSPPSAPVCPKMWHRRFAHLHQDALQSMLGRAAIAKDEHQSKCAVCIRAKHRRRISRKPQRRATAPFQLVHSDFCGPMSVDSNGGHRYYILFIDDFSRWTFVHFLKSKDRQACCAAFREMRAFVQTQYGYSIQRFRCDNGRGEYDNALFTSILAAGGISFEPAPPYTQHKNGVSERMIQTLNAKARAMMLDAQLPGEFWGEIINTACYLHRRSPTRSLGGHSPYEVLHTAMYSRDHPTTATTSTDFPSFQPPLHHLRRVGCTAWKVIPKEQRQDPKFGARSRPCMMLGYVHHSTNMWRLWDFETNSGETSGRAFTWADVEWEEDLNAFYSAPLDSDSITADSTDTPFPVDAVDTGDLPSQPAPSLTADTDSASPPPSFSASSPSSRSSSPRSPDSGYTAAASCSFPAADHDNAAIPSSSAACANSDSSSPPGSRFSLFSTGLAPINPVIPVFARSCLLPR